MIVDAHAHLGECRVFDLDVSEDDLIETMDRHGVDTAVVQPYPGAVDPRKTHDRIAELAVKHPGRVFGLCSLNPHLDRDDYAREVERCVKELNFVALKMHTIGHAVLPLSVDGAAVFEVAHDLGIPVMVHTGPGVPFALPSLLVPYAVKYPTMTIIVAHAGSGIYSPEAVVLAERHPNLYLEHSWCSVDDIQWMINTVGSARVMLGSDSLRNLPVELAKLEALGLSAADYDQVIGRTAVTALRLPISPAIDTSPPNSPRRRELAG